MQAVKSEAFSSPLNGGLMEKILQRLCVLDDRTLPPQLTPCVTPFHTVCQPAGHGGEA
ncbi:hypothetical protein KPSA3_07701 [Pseudomonas syringae pv. actinidiae]|uniref:Uncharacterized protein n=1 Tax=Pseudomonas syringae pv. actinidiae TaxID=103796 RepID=A0AAN4QDU1_PSESF|nr:hypothetical protein KPSA3_07701 [Pseudomonas syringae pv. actinidiae]